MFLLPLIHFRFASCFFRRASLMRPRQLLIDEQAADTLTLSSFFRQPAAAAIRYFSSFRRFHAAE